MGQTVIYIDPYLAPSPARQTPPPLKPEEVAYVSEMVRRIAAILLLGRALDANYATSKSAAVAWKDGAPVEAT